MEFYRRILICCRLGITNCAAFSIISHRHTLKRHLSVAPQLLVLSVLTHANLLPLANICDTD